MNHLLKRLGIFRDKFTKIVINTPKCSSKGIRNTRPSLVEEGVSLAPDMRDTRVDRFVVSNVNVDPIFGIRMI
jgi:hypothetical protein